MIKNSDLFYNRAAEFQSKRKEIIDTYESTLAKLEKAKGSQLYTEETEKAAKTRDAALQALQSEYREYFRISLDAMSEANAARKMTPPTEEELRTLQLLKMKDKPTEAELAAAANTLKGNATCLSVLTEIAHKSGYMRGYMGYSEAKELPVSEVEEAIKGLSSSVRDFLNHDTKKTARIAQAYYEHNFMPYADARDLPKRSLFNDKSGCFYEIARMGGDYLTAFCKAVDGE